MEISGLHAFVLIQNNPLIDPAIIQPSVLETICGQEAILYTTRLLESLSITTTLIIDNTPHAHAIERTVKQFHADRVNVVTQEQLNNQTFWQLVCESSVNTFLIFERIMPLLPATLITQLYAQHKQTNAMITSVIADSDDTQHNTNAGIFMIQRSLIHDFSTSCSNLIKKAQAEQKIVRTLAAAYDDVRSISTFQELWAIEQSKHSQLIMEWMNKGVRFSAPQTVQIDLTVTIGIGSFIGFGVHLRNNTGIGSYCYIDAFTLLDQVQVGDKSRIYSHSVIKKSCIGTQVQIGPFAHVNGDNSIADEVMLGNFVEIKRTNLGTKTRVKHLSYLGDATIGNNVNIGAGTITCNHDGFAKHITTIEDNAYIGTNTTLIAPLTIEHDAFIAAGSTITNNVPSYALALARTRQTNKEGYVHFLREKKQKTSSQPAVSTPDSPTDDAQQTSFIGAVKPTTETKPSNV